MSTCMGIKAENGDKMLDECVGAVSTVCLLCPPTRCALWEADAQHSVYFSRICEVFLHPFLQDQIDSYTLVHNQTPAGNKATQLEKSDPRGKIIPQSIMCKYFTCLYRSALLRFSIGLQQTYICYHVQSYRPRTISLCLLFCFMLFSWWSLSLTR